MQEDELPLNLQKGIAEFLSNRKLVLRGRSNLIPVRAGVPQGSVLSPTLYNYYLKDLPRSEKGWKVVYADDITQVVDHPRWDSTYSQFKRGTAAGRRGEAFPQEEADAAVLREAMEEVRQVDEYERTWKIRTNRTKFQAMPLLAKKQRSYVMSDGSTIDGALEATFLGLKFGRWNLNRQGVARLGMARKSLAELQTLRSFLTEDLKLRLVKSIVIPTLLYPPLCFENPNKMLKDAMEVLERKCVRFIKGRSQWDRDRREWLHAQAEDLGLEHFYDTARRLSNKVRERIRNDGELMDLINRSQWGQSPKVGFPGALHDPG